MYPCSRHSWGQASSWRWGEGNSLFLNVQIEHSSENNFLSRRPCAHSFATNPQHRQNPCGGRNMADEKQNPKQQSGQQQQPQKQQHGQPEDRKSQQGGQNTENQKGQGSSDRGS